MATDGVKLETHPPSRKKPQRCRKSPSVETPGIKPSLDKKVKSKGNRRPGPNLARFKICSACMTHKSSQDADAQLELLRRKNQESMERLRQMVKIFRANLRRPGPRKAQFVSRA